MDTIPQPLGIINWRELIDLCMEYIDGLADGEYHKDIDDLIFEKTMECVYGTDIWDWINEKSDEF
jgi:hypothetical protein